MSASRLCALLVLAALPFGGKPYRKTEQGNERYAAGAWAEALRDYTEAQTAAPEAPELYYDLGNVLYRQEDYAGAAELYERALLSAASPQLVPQAAYNLGNARFRQGEFDAAVDAYERALRNDPADRDAKRNLELALRALEQQQKQPQQQPQSSPEQDSKQQQGGAQPQPQPQPKEGGEQQPTPSSQPQPQPQGAAGMNREDAERLLDGVEAKERDARRDAARRAKRADAPPVEKDW